jgi:hypothetical protein
MHILDIPDTLEPKRTLHPHQDHPEPQEEPMTNTERTCTVPTDKVDI